MNSVKDSLVQNDKKKNFVTFNMVGGNEGYQDVPKTTTKRDFDYSEIWQDKDHYRDLLKIVEDTRATNGGKAVVIAGYMNYKQATGIHYEAGDVQGIPKADQFFSRIGKTAGWVGDFGKKDEDQIIWTVDVPTAGTYSFGLDYGHDNGESPNGKLTVNNAEVVPSIDFNEKTGWGNPVAAKSYELDLQAGKNEIMLSLNSNNLWLNVDSITLEKGDFAKEYEAEDAELISCKVDKYGHVFNFETDGDYIEFDVNVKEAGTYPLSFQYGVEQIDVSRNLYVNGDPVKDKVLLKSTGGWENFQPSAEIPVPLKAGAKKVVLKVEDVNDTGAKIDYLSVGTDRYQAEKAISGWEPSQTPLIKAADGALTEFKQQGDFMTFTRDTDQAKETGISIYYKNPGEETERSIFINGKKAGVFILPHTEGEGFQKAESVVYLPQGTNEVMVKMEEATTPSAISVDKLTIEDDVYEAEKAEFGWSPAMEKTSQVSISPGYTDNFGNKGQRVIFNVDNEEETDTLTFKYRTGNNPQVNIYVDGELIPANNSYVDGKTISENIFSSTPGGWGGAMAEKSIKASVPAGEHEVVFELASNGQYINLDSLTAGEKEYQVEDASFGPDGHGISTTTGHVYDFKDENDFLDFQVKAGAAGSYDLVWKYNNDSASKRDARRSVYINGEKTEDITFPSSNGWQELEMKNISLKEGINSIKIAVENIDDDGVKLDYLQAGEEKWHAESVNTLAPMHIYKDTLLNFGHVGDEVTFEADLEEDGETSFIFTYANAGADTERTIYIDGEPVLDDNGNPYTVVFKGTGSKDSYSEDGYIVLPDVTSGTHRITLKQEEGQKGSIDLRRMTIGLFDEPSVRLMDAGLAAMGATHIEIGTAENYEEGPNMLAHEYYPNRSKKMSESLKESMKDYYKFFAAYENLLFDSKETDKNVVIEKENTEVKTSTNGEQNSIWTIARDNKDNAGFEDYEIVHLINLLQNDSNWRNAAAKPEKQENLVVRYPVGKTKKELRDLRVYAASPDAKEGQLQEIPFTWQDDEIVISLPELEYWQMIVIDRDGAENKKAKKIKF
nr:glycoside hydrolase family 66 protein [Bacillus salacetis]